MSTPIQQLPPTSVGGAELPTDPEVMAVLNEMEAEVTAARNAAAAAGAASAAAANAARAPQQGAGAGAHGPPMMYGAPPMPPPGCYFSPSGGLVCGGGGDGGSALWNVAYAQNAAIAAVIALALFYPASLEAFYQKIPVARIAALFSSNDKLVRAALFAAIIYVLLMRMNA